MAAEPLIVIVGETASGKSALAMDLAKRFDGEIICADSRTVYKDMDIGTAKPSKLDQKKIPHYLLDIIEAGQPFTVAEFKRLAHEAIQDISKKGKLPIMVGGSGLYVDSVIFDYQFSEKSRSKDPKNPRHLKPNPDHGLDKKLRPNTLIIGLKLDRDELQKRITKRVGQMFSNGLIDEAKNLGNKYGWEIEVLKTPGYKALRRYLNNELNVTEAKELFIRSDMQLAKKQRTWFKRNNSIQWVSDPIKAVDLATTFLNKLQ